MPTYLVFGRDGQAPHPLPHRLETLGPQRLIKNVVKWYNRFIKFLVDWFG